MSLEEKVTEKLILARDFQIGDLKRSIFCAKTNFLTALGLFSYTEFWGHFITGKDATQKSFDEFFKFLGTEYVNALTNEPDIYNLIRCGLAHEYLVKKLDFCILGTDEMVSDEQIKKTAPCGVVITPRKIEVYNARYYVDLKEAIDNFLGEIPQRLGVADSPLLARFEKVNFDNFS